jgi:hypothetical protein
MAKLVYWVAECANDSQAYSLIAKTKKELKAKIESNGGWHNYGEIEKRAIHYTDAFDLFDQATGEGGGRVYAGLIE